MAPWEGKLPPAIVCGGYQTAHWAPAIGSGLAAARVGTPEQRWLLSSQREAPSLPRPQPGEHRGHGPHMSQGPWLQTTISRHLNTPFNFPKHFTPLNLFASSFSAF